jgi:ligand-binding sensor domain-containing protein/signal transduction histidine kinase
MLGYAALFLCWAAPQPLWPIQGPKAEFSRRIWHLQDGLPQSRIQSLVQTPDGYLWVGTSGGLARFDGVRFTVFNRSNTPALLDDSILALCTGRDGSLWIGTEGGGLVQMKGGIFRTYGPAEGLSNRFVRALHEDRSGILWVGTDRGFFRMQAGRLERLDNQGGAPVLSVLSIREAPGGKLWVAATQGFWTLEDGRLTRHPYQIGNGDAVVQRLGIQRDGTVWMATAQGLFQWKDGRAHKLPGSELYNYQQIYEDSRGDLWIATLAHGLLRLSQGKLTKFEAPDMLPINTVLTVFEDRQHSLWVGTQDGLVRLSKRIVSVLGKDEGLQNDNLMTVYEDRDGSAWVATMSGEFYRVKDGKAALVRLPFEDFRARTVLRTRQGDLWLGSYNRGVLWLSGGQLRSFSLGSGLRNNSIRHILEDRQGHIWIATGSGLSRWDGRELVTYYLHDGLAYGSVRVLAEDPHGDLIVGTDGGVNRVRNGKFVKDPALDLVGSERVWAILPRQDGSLWLGTRGGGLLHIKDGKLTRITSRHGLLSDHIYQLLEGPDGRLWMSGPAGVSAAAFADLEAVVAGRSPSVPVAPFGVAEGMGSSQMNGGIQPAGWRMSNGELWFPSVKGLVQIDPRRSPSSVPSTVFIESILVNDREMPLADEIRIPPGRGRLEIHYTACDLLAPERVTFRFMLEGFDNGWLPASFRRTAYYTNLPPGTYRFRVARLDAAAPHSVSEASLALVWEPRFYETKWFYAAFGLLLAALAWGGFRLYARQTRQRYQALLDERVRLAREMHDTVIQGCVGISTLLEAASGLPPSENGGKEALLERARLQARVTLEEARQAVWDLRHVSHGQSLDATLRDYAARLSAERGVPVDVSAEGDLGPLGARAERNLLLVAREAMRNALTHADPSRVWVRLSAAKDTIRLEVGDDGKGFDVAHSEAAENGHYGIAGMRERMEQLGGSLEILTAPGSGTRVVACAPRQNGFLDPISEAAHE